MELEEKVSEEPRAIDPQEPVVHEPVVDVLLPPYRSIHIPPERYMGMLTEEIKEIFLMRDRSHSEDPNILDETMSDIDFKKWLDTMKSEIDSMHSNQI